MNHRWSLCKVMLAFLRTVGEPNLGGGAINERRMGIPGYSGDTILNYAMILFDIGSFHSVILCHGSIGESCGSWGCSSRNAA